MLNLIQNSSAYDAGRSIGYFIGRLFPIIVIAIVAYFIYRYFKNKSKNSLWIFSIF